MNRGSQVSFKELMEKRQQIMKARDEYIEIPLDNEEIEMKSVVANTKSTMTQQQPTVNLEKKTPKKNKLCRWLGAFTVVAGMMVLNDYLLLTYFV
tara:strand:- start:79 stop:363 length:285 start_codon:yes stop_codon:yes gene_type:complete